VDLEEGQFCDFDDVEALLAELSTPGPVRVIKPNVRHWHG